MNIKQAKALLRAAGQQLPQPFEAGSHVVHRDARGVERKATVLRVRRDQCDAVEVQFHDTNRCEVVHNASRCLTRA